MPAVYPKQGLPYLLNWLLRRQGLDVLPWRVHLFVNDIVPEADNVFTDFQVADFGGYSPVELSRDNWTDAVIVGDEAEATYTDAPQSWTCTNDGQVVYGYLITDVFDTLLLVAERFDEPVEVDVGGVIGVLPRVALATCAAT